MDKNRMIILGIGVAFIGAAIGLSRCSEEQTKTPDEIAKDDGFKKRDVAYPRQAVAQRRVKQRRKDKPLDNQRAMTTKASIDGIHRAMGGPESTGAVFLEVNAIRYSGLAEKILKCRGDEVGNEIDRLKDQLGVDPAEDLDRLAIQDGMVAATGNFASLKLPESVQQSATDYGDNAKIYDMRGTSEGDGVVAVVGDGLVLMGDSPATVQAAVDRVEGRTPSARVIPRGLENAEVYGRVDQGMIASLLSTSTDPVATRFAELVKEGFVRINVDEQVAISLDMKAGNPDEAEDLAKAVGGALAGLRKKAADDGEDELAWLLEKAEVRPGADGSFEIDAAVPGDYILKLLGCDESGANTNAPRSPSAVPATPATPNGNGLNLNPNNGAATFEPTLKPPTSPGLPGRAPSRGFPTVIDDGT